MNIEIEIDLSPTWWQRNRLIQRIRHTFGRCEGTAMISGRECPLCLKVAIQDYEHFKNMCLDQYAIESFWWDSAYEKHVKVISHDEDGIWVRQYPDASRVHFPFKTLEDRRRLTQA